MNASEFRKKSNLKWKGLKILSQIELKAFWRNKNILYSQIIQPLMYFLFLVVGIGGTIGVINYNNMMIPYEAYALVGIMGLNMTSQMTQTIYRTTIDKRWGLLPLKFLSGIKPFYYILGMSTFPIIGFVTQSLILYFLSVIFTLNVHILDFFLGVSLGIVSLIFWTSLGVLLTVFINDYQKRDTIIAMSIMPIGFSAPTFYVIDAVPNYINFIASFNPLTYQIMAMRSIIYGQPNLMYIILTIGLTTFVLIICSIVLLKVKLVVNEK